MCFVVQIHFSFCALLMLHKALGKFCYNLVLLSHHTWHSEKQISKWKHLQSHRNSATWQLYFFESFSISRNYENKDFESLEVASFLFSVVYDNDLSKHDLKVMLGSHLNEILKVPKFQKVCVTFQCLNKATKLILILSTLQL